MTIDHKKISVRQIRLNDCFHLKSFTCNNRSIEAFLKNEAYPSTIEMDASTSLVFYENELVGFFTLKPDKIEVEDEEEGIKHVICLEISRIATSSSYQGRGIGTFMLLHIVNLARSVNYRYIVLDALIEKADWYINRNFIPLVESEHIVSNEHGLVYMYRDLYDVELVETFYDELTG